MPFDQQRLRYFVAIAEGGSLSAAAVRMHVAQPALSHHLAYIERQLELKLFDRHPRGMALTPAGSRFLEHARQILADIDRAQADLRQLAGSRAAQVTLGLLSAPASFLTPHLLRAVAIKRPSILVNVVEGDSVMLRSLVQTGNVDLALNLAEAVGPSTPAVASEDLYLVGPPNSIFGKRRTVTLAEALQMRLILPGARNQLRALIEKAAAQIGQKPDIVMQIDGIIPLKQAVIAGFGYTIMSWPVVERERAARLLKTHRIVRPNISRRFVIDVPGVPPTVGPIAQLEALLRRLLHQLAQESHWPAALISRGSMEPASSQE